MTAFRTCFWSLAALTLSTGAQAGVRIGNGGDGLLCHDATGDHVQLLDYYEARALRGLVPDLGASDLDPLAKAKRAVARLARLDGARAELYTSRLDAFASEARFIPDAALTEIPDVHVVVTPAGCTLKQLAIQRSPEFPGDPYYIIDRDLWDLMDDDAKAGLMLHEVIYREAIEYGATDSVASRYLNGVISSTQLESAEWRDYSRILTAAGLPYWFLWHDDVTGKTWRAHEDADRSVDWCLTAGYADPTQGDLVRAYPRLGAALSALQLTDPTNPYVFLLQSGGFDGFAFLYPDQFSTDRARHTGVSSRPTTLMCIQ